MAWRKSMLLGGVVSSESKAVGGIRTGVQGGGQGVDPPCSRGLRTRCTTSGIMSGRETPSS